MPLIDFRNLDDSKFHRLCNDLVTAEYPTARCIEGSGGDNGIDCYNGDSTDKFSTVFQHKFLPRTLGSSGKNQIKQSLTTVLRRFNIKKWMLLIPKNFTIGETQWFNSLEKLHPTIELDVWNETKLRALLRKHTRIRYDYFQLSEAELKIKNDHELKIIETSTNWSNLKLSYERPFYVCKGLMDSNGKGIETFPYYGWALQHLQTGYEPILEAHNNMDIVILEYNKAVNELQRNIEEKVKARFEKDYKILEASLSGELEKGVYKNAFYLDEINPLVFISIQQLTLNKIFYPDKSILKINEVTNQGVKYFILSTAAALLCTLDKVVANEDKFLKTIESLANESQLI
jgi:hypothetical protein